MPIQQLPQLHTGLHKLASNIEAGKMASSGKYTEIGLNKALSSLGLEENCRPDVIGLARKGVNLIVEVVSPKQDTSYIVKKMAKMLSQNTGSAGKIIKWVRMLLQ